MSWLILGGNWRMVPIVKTVLLPSGECVPAFGLGTWRSELSIQRGTVG
jgi:hypothetical protein